MIVDNFAGGGGASLGIEMALGRSPDVAINHDAAAVCMHAANHPQTQHYCQSVFRADPKDIAAGRAVDLAWFSPDCTHHSKAKGGKPRKKSIRDLAWVVVMWAERVRPAVIILENVEEFRQWGPLDAEGHPIADRKGETFNFWIRQLRRCGYKVDWREQRACDYGAPTIRKRLFLVARCDGLPIVWPAATHGPEGSGLLPFRTAAEIIDWSIPAPSIFERQKPLADKTLARIARGIQRFVIDAAQPFIVPVGYGERGGQLPRVHALADPLPTVVASGTKHHLVNAFIIKHFGGMTGVPVTTPLPTITTRGTQNQLATSSIIKLRGTCRDGHPVTEPLHTISAGGTHFGEVRALLTKYYGAGTGQGLEEPLHSVTTKDRFALVTVQGEVYAISDIGMRMLVPRELFRAQGFPDSYKIDPLFNGKPMTKTLQVEKCGNSVSPVHAAAIIAANCPHLMARAA